MNPNEQAKNLRDTYAAMHGDVRFDPHPSPWWDGSMIGNGLRDYQAIIANTYVDGPWCDSLVVRSYRIFAQECIAQFRAMVEHGVKVQFCDTDPTPMADGPNGPYPSIKLLMAEYERTRVLRVYRSPEGFHPLLDQHIVRYEPWQCDGHGREETANSIFRAVHDYFGHLASGGYFNWEGETTAYYSHARMFSKEARAALFCETVAQQSVYAVTGDYAEQKCVKYGPEWHNPPLR